MPFSKTFAGLIILGIVPIILGAFFGMSLHVFILYNLILSGLLIVDFIITPGADSLDVKRECDRKLSMGSENIIKILIRNNSSHILNIEARDEVPCYMDVIGGTLNIKSMPHYENSGSYKVIPQKRGEYTFGDISIRYRGVLKLCMKYGSFDTKEDLKVYPNLKDLKRYSFASLRKNLILIGNKKMKTYGMGTEFESLREYSEGDDYRKVNWMATARSSKLIVNNYEPERNQQVYILLDSSRVMNTEINYIKKLDYAINSAFLLAEIAGKKGDNIGLMVFDKDVKRFVKSGKGMTHFSIMAENLYNVEENFVTADYDNALFYFCKRQRRRSLLCIFTDLFNSQEALSLVKALKTVGRNHVPLVITIKDMRVYEMADNKINTVADIYDKCAALKEVDEREKIQKIFESAGIASIDVPPDKLSMEVVNKYLNIKAMMQLS
ncbi:MAG TPA: DUF58 domain-containing protein [Pseudobacteroides sp.]|nr:DUF58 domain-containing protein [Pseudobacteroides sp.]